MRSRVLRSSGGNAPRTSTDEAPPDSVIILLVERPPRAPGWPWPQRASAYFEDFDLPDLLRAIALLQDSPVQLMPSGDQPGVPGLVGLNHFHSSTTSGAASLV